MPDRVRLYLRRSAIVVVFILGVVATAATSQPVTSIDIAPARGTLLLDQERPASLSRIVVLLNPEATSTDSNVSVYLRIDAVRAAGGAVVGAPGAVGQARFIVTSAMPGTSPSPIASPLPDADPLPTPWQANVPTASQVSLPIDCGRSGGPCERAFWLIAELTDSKARGVDVDWQVSGSLSYAGNSWPSGAEATVEIGDPTLLAGPAPHLGASTEAETLTLGPDQPAAAREVEVRVGAAAIPQDGSPVGVVSVELARRPGSDGSPLTPPLVQIYPIDGPSAMVPPVGANPPPPATPDLDPFAGCPIGADCARRFLVTLMWTGDSEAEVMYDWTLSVRRVDLVRVWSTPAVMSSRVLRRFDVAPDVKPSTVRFEGAATAVAFDAPPQVQLALATRTTSTDPLAVLLPVPAVMTYRASVVEPRASSSGERSRANTVITARIPQSGIRPLYEGFIGGEANVVANPMANPTGACRIGEACPDLTIATIVSPSEQGAQLPTVRFQWSLDLAVYSFTDIPISLSAADRSPGTRR